MPRAYHNLQNRFKFERTVGMMIDKRRNRSGGSAGGGGYDYQAEAYTLVAAKILAEESLNWPETGCDRVPVSIRLETGSGGDDLRIMLHQGATIEVQAKRGLKQTHDLWHALMGLAQAVNADSSTYGVLLTTTDASTSVKNHLKEGIIKLGQGIEDDLPVVVRKFFKCLQDNGFENVPSVCSRIRIIIRDFDPGSSGEEETLAALRKVVAEPQQAGAARHTLVGDGFDLIRLKGRHDASGLARVIKQAGIPLALSATNQMVLRETFIDWSAKANDTISIPSLKVALPMSKAWVHLRVMATQESSQGSKALADQVRDYHEWHRLAEASHPYDTLDIEKVARRERLLVVLGGPGSGKSTLLRRLARAWSSDRQVVLRVSLRAVALRTSKGETFDEALLTVALEGFPKITEAVSSLLRGATCLLADGLDETDPNRSGIADRLRRWALANAERRVVLTTRPVGHNPAWFEEWKHYELVPLGRYDVNKCVQTIFNLLHPNDPERAAQMSNAFLEKLDRSRTASIAARNPQLLSLLITLYINGSDLAGNRFRLFGKVIEEIRKQTIRDRAMRHEMDAPIALRALECLGWSLVHNPILSEDELVSLVGQQLADELALQPLQGQQIASMALSFWEERGLVERLSAGAATTCTFVHTTFQDFASARFLEQFPEEEFVHWLHSKRNVPGFRETLLLTGGTRRLALTIHTLLDTDNPSDPVSTDALLAADVLAEAEEPPADLREKVSRHLVPRLTSNVPMIAYEAGEKLRPLVLTNPLVTGPLALQLARHEQQWTREVACGLGLLSGDKYVDVETLLAVFPAATDSGLNSVPGLGVILDHPNLLMCDFLIKGAEYLLRDNSPAVHLEIVKAKYKDGNYSMRVHESLHSLLANRLTREELRAIRTNWLETFFENGNVDQALREAYQALMEAILIASEGLAADHAGLVADPKMGSIARLWRVLDIGKSPMPEIYRLRHRHLQDALVDVIRGAILAAALKPMQVKAEAERALRELAQPQNSLYRLISDSEEFESQTEPDWTLPKQQWLQPNLLLQAMSHPSWFVCKFAAFLLWECIERDIVRSGLKEVLANGSGYALEIIAHNATEIWQDEAADLVLDRLERNFTEDCSPLVKTLGELCDGSSKQRAESVLLRALALKNADMVHAALHAIEKISLDELLVTTIKDCYRWWLAEGPQDPIGGGVVPKNPAAALLSYLSDRRRVSFEEVHEAANAKRSDVRNISIKAICQFLDEEDGLVETTLSDIACGKLPNRIPIDLSISYPAICSQHSQSFLRLLDSDIRSVQIAGIRALGSGWADYPEVKDELRSLLNAPDVSLRDEAVAALRRLCSGHSSAGS